MRIIIDTLNLFEQTYFEYDLFEETGNNLIQRIR